MAKNYKKVLKKKKGYSYLHHKTGEKVVVGPHKQHYRMRIYQPISKRKAMEAFDKRSTRSKSIDKANRSKHTKEDPDEQWLENQNRLDIEGIDTPPEKKTSLKKRLKEIREEKEKTLEMQKKTEWKSEDYKKLEQEYYDLIQEEKRLENKIFYNTHSIQKLSDELDLPENLKIQKNPMWGFRLKTYHKVFDETQPRWEPSDPLTLDSDTLKGFLPKDAKDWDEFEIKTKDLLNTIEMRDRIREYYIQQEKEQRKEILTKAKKQYQQEKQNKQKNRLIKKAKTTGKKQLLKTYSTPCINPNEECNVDIVQVFIDENGQITEERIHTY